MLNEKDIAKLLANSFMRWVMTNEERFNSDNFSPLEEELITFCHKEVASITTIMRMQILALIYEALEKHCSLGCTNV